MLQAMNTGHDGSLSTGHANSSRDMLLRLETMVLMGSMQLPILRSGVRSLRQSIYWCIWEGYGMEPGKCFRSVKSWK